MGVSPGAKPGGYGGGLLPMNAEKIKVLLVEDDALFRLGLSLVIRNQPELELVDEVEDGESALAAVGDGRCPDIVLLDLGLPGLGGQETLRRLKRDHPGIRVLVLTSREEARLVQAAVREGADGYCLKGITPEHLLTVIKEVAAGHGWFDAKVLGFMREAMLCEGSAPLPSAALTDREREVLRWIARGASNQKIGEQLHISEGTVRVHVHAILRKLGASDRTQAATIALTQGLI
jgi:two-component system NarL family response regulator